MIIFPFILKKKIVILFAFMISNTLSYLLSQFYSACTLWIRFKVYILNVHFRKDFQRSTSFAISCKKKKSKNRIKKKCLHFHSTRPQEHNETMPRIERNAFFFNILFFLIKKKRKRKRFPGVLTETLGRLTINFSMEKNGKEFNEKDRRPFM